MSVYTPTHSSIAELRDLLILEVSPKGVTYQHLADKYGVNKGTLSAIILREHEPKDPELRIKLGLPSVAEVHAVSGTIAPGAVSVADKPCPTCHRTYIPNTGNRKWCQVCSPPIGMKVK